jgi:hypothetical protein
MGVCTSHTYVLWISRSDGLIPLRAFTLGATCESTALALLLDLPSFPERHRCWSGAIITRCWKNYLSSRNTEWTV